MSKYLTDIIGDDYRSWGKAKVFLNAPTGAGKTTFILKVLLPYYRERNYKLLILCNRRMLHDQYEASLATYFPSYRNYDNVRIMSYQQFARLNEEEIRKMLKDFHGICLDECHYFVQDSDFSSDTYKVWKLITGRFYSKQQIFISATMDCMKPFIEDYKKNIHHDPLVDPAGHGCRFIDIDRYTLEPDYSYLELLGVPNEKTLCEKIVADGGKALIFIDSKSGAARLKKLLEDCGMKSGTVVTLNADELERQNGLRNSLVYGEKFPQGIYALITTSVLDNGVSLTDVDVTSICVFATSKTEFIQMIGRVRRRENHQVKLYLVERSHEEFEKKLEYLKEEVKIIDECKPQECSRKIPSYFKEVYDNTRRGEILRRILYHEDTKTVALNDKSIGTSSLYINRFAEHKIRETLHEMTAIRSNTEKDRRYLPNLQAKWLGLTPDCISWDKEETAEQKLRSYIFDAMREKVNNEKFREVKKKAVKICVQFNIEKKYNVRDDRTPENAKFIKICKDVGLLFLQGKENNKAWYQVSKQGGSL